MITFKLRETALRSSDTFIGGVLKTRESVMLAAVPGASSLFGTVDVGVLGVLGVGR